MISTALKALDANSCECESMWMWVIWLRYITLKI